MTAIALLMAMTTAVSIIGYTRPTVKIYDQSGARIGEMNASDLPRPLPADRSEDTPNLKVVLSGKVLFLRPIDVLVDNGDIICDDQSLSARSAESKGGVAEGGVIARLAPKGVHCFSREDGKAAPTRPGTQSR
jgi:hypothetical protein